MRDVLTPRDRDILRPLATRFVEISQEPENLERMQVYRDLHDLRSARPAIKIESGLAVQAFGVLDNLQCEGQWARAAEGYLRDRIWVYENVCDDFNVIEPVFPIPWDFSAGDFGVPVKKTHGQASEVGHGSYTWEPVIKDLQQDLPKLRHRQCSVDRESTLEKKALAEQAFGDILPVRQRGWFWWTQGMTWEAAELAGLENLMLWMYDDPDGLHALMQFLVEDNLGIAEWAEREGLMTSNNDCEWIGSGSVGYVSDLPAPAPPPGKPAKLKDLWVLLESQETVGVSPELFAEFIFPYQKRIAERFGLVYYGCCEPVHKRFETLKQMPNLRIVSVSPWCDQAEMARLVNRDYVLDRKPNPTLISTETFDEDAIRADLRQTLETLAGQHLEICMKDVHTIRGQGERIARWVQLAREAVDTYWKG